LGGGENPDETARENQRREDGELDSPQSECPSDERDQRNDHSGVVNEIEDLVEPGTELRRLAACACEETVRVVERERELPDDENHHDQRHRSRHWSCKDERGADQVHDQPYDADAVR